MKLYRRKLDEDPELNLTPLMDMFVGLIPFLILAATFARFSGVNVDVPAAASKGSPEAAVVKSDEISLVYEVQESKVSVTGFNKDFTRPLDKVKASFELTELAKFQTWLTSLRANNKVASQLFYASSNTKYDNAMVVINVIKSFDDPQNPNNLILAAGIVE